MIFPNILVFAIRWLKRSRSVLTFIFLMLLHTSCIVESRSGVTDIECEKMKYQAENVVIIVIDGPRLSETWEHPQKAHIPYLRDSLSPNALIKTEFYNMGNTYTVPGHISITTGSYEFKENDGTQYPENPSLFQSMLSCSGMASTNAYLVSAKGKLEVLGDCESIAFRNSFRPGMYTRSLNDKEVLRKAINVLETHQPRLLMVHFQSPDIRAHAKDWEGYIKAIEETDKLMFDLIRYLDASVHYSDRTAVFMTNDHGRHLDGIKDGYVSHGDHCRGCTHINFMAYGPDFRSNTICDKSAETIDILPTVGEILGFRSSWASGRVMTEIFQ